MRYFVLLLIINSNFASAEQVVGIFAKEHAKKSGVKGESLTSKKVINLMKYLSTGFLFQNEVPGSHNDPPPGGSHPYEWDSLRSSEEMLEKCNGGSCGTFGLSGAAILRAGGLADSDLGILGGVLSKDYLSLCPKEGKEYDSKKPWSDGHVFLQVKINGKWYLLNTTHNPLKDHLRNRSESKAVNTFLTLKDNCYKEAGKEMPRKDPGPPNGQEPGPPKKLSEEDKKFNKCMEEAVKAGMDRLELADLEMVPFYSPEEVQKKMDEGPLDLPIEKFPSLVQWMGQGEVPHMIGFKNWKFKDYPIHTYKDRLNMVSSGQIKSKICRYNKEDVAATLSSQEPGSEDYNEIKYLSK